jgi:probable HAF family extracellular repeat protein
MMEEASMRILIERLVVPAALLVAGLAYARNSEEPKVTATLQYKVKNLASNGGTVSSGNSINDLGWAAGFSNLSGDTTTHATLWLGGLKFDLKTLGGDNSGVIWPVKNDQGLISGIAETAAMDPNGESWSCSAFFPTVTHHTCLGVVWEFGKIRALPTLGGNNGFATGTNNLRQTVGWAENTVHDSTCTGRGQVLQFLAVIWGPGKDDIQPLPPLPPVDTTSAATAINDRGQVVGISGICDRAVGRFSAAHSVLWENGEVTEIPNLGGDAWNTPMAINEWGDVVGFANITTGGAFNAHAFLWTKSGGIKDLGTLPGDAYSQALGINNWRQVVGLSCAAGFVSCRGFLWQNGVMTDFNELVAPGYDDEIYAAGDINDSGQVTGQSFNAGTNVYSTFLAVPTGGQFQAHGAKVLGRRVKLPEHVRQMLLRRSGLGGDDR